MRIFIFQKWLQSERLFIVSKFFLIGSLIFVNCTFAKKVFTKLSLTQDKRNKKTMLYHSSNSGWFSYVGNQYFSFSFLFWIEPISCQYVWYCLERYNYINFMSKMTGYQRLFSLSKTTNCLRLEALKVTVSCFVLAKIKVLVPISASKLKQSLMFQW